MIPFSCLAQESVDTNLVLVTTDVWDDVPYKQEGKIFNRSVWTFADNPALAGFDRKLAVAYRFQMKNLAMGVPNDEGNLELAMMKHEAFVDLPFGGPKQNWGLGLYYAHEKEFQHKYHTVQMARSLRINLVKEHYLILGLSFGVQFGKLENWGSLTFGDMIDPRFGFIYQTQEVKPNTTSAIAILQGGLRYYWKRFSFDYTFHQGPNGLGGLSGYSSPLTANRIKTVYHVNAGDGVTISPELMLNITNVNVRTGGTSIFSAYTSITYLDMVYGQIGISELNKLRFQAGYQFRDILVVQVGLSSYLDRTMDKIAGIASIDGGVRFQLKAWNR